MEKPAKEITRIEEDDIVRIARVEDQDLLSELTGGPRLNLEPLLTEILKAKRLALATIENIEKTESHSRVTKRINFAILGILCLLGVVIVFGMRQFPATKPQSPAMSAGGRVLLDEKEESPTPRRAFVPIKERLEGNFKKVLATGGITVGEEEVAFGIVTGGWSGRSVFLWLDKEIEKTYLDQIALPWGFIEVTPRESCRILVGEIDQWFYPNSSRSDHGFKYREAVDKILTTVNDLPSFRVENVSYWTDY
jgi:hypothetical protein